MKRAAVLLAGILLANSLNAQEFPKADISVGWTFLLFQPGFRTGTTGLNGWHASATGRASRRIGITADFAGNYGSPLLTAATSLGSVRLNSRLTNYTFLFGPTVTVHNARRTRLFANALFGAGHAKQFLQPALAGVPVVAFNQTDSSWAAAAGGGYDLNFTSWIAGRVAFDWVRTNYFHNAQNNARFVTGVVLKLARKS